MGALMGDGLPYVLSFTDRHGKRRHYFRRKGRALVALPGAPGSPEFLRAYELASGGKIRAGEKRAKPGSVAALVAAYLASANFRDLKPITQASYRLYVEPFREKYGGMPIARMSGDDVSKIIGQPDTPAAGNNVLGAIRRLVRFGMAMSPPMLTVDPTLNVKRRKTPKTGGFIAWTDDDIAAFRGVHGVDTRAGLALALLLYTAQRRADVVRMGWQHISRGRIAVRQSKTDERLRIPLHRELSRVLEVTPRENMTFLVTDYGKPFTPAGFGNWFGERCREAGLGLNAHGLRKAAARRLVEAGCSVHEVMAITGHRTLSEVQRYTREVEQERMADSAVARLSDKPA
jgi:integrase